MSGDPTWREVAAAAEQGEACPGCGAAEPNPCTHRLDGMCPFYRDPPPDLLAPSHIVKAWWDRQK